MAVHSLIQCFGDVGFCIGYHSFGEIWYPKLKLNYLYNCTPKERKNVLLALVYHRANKHPLVALTAIEINEKFIQQIYSR